MSQHSTVNLQVYTFSLSIISLFYVELVQAIEKLQKRCVVKFTESDMQVICASEVNEGGIQVWAYARISYYIFNFSLQRDSRQVRVSSLFVDYRIQSNAGNQITVILSSEALLAALRSSSAQGSTSSNTALSDIEVVMKCVVSSTLSGVYEVHSTLQVGEEE